MAHIKYYTYPFVYFYVFLCLDSVTPSKSEERARTYNTPFVQHLKTNEISPYVDLILCPVRAQPWTCARQESARVLDIWNAGLYLQWQKLKVDADQELNVTLEKRGYSGSETLSKEKPSTILKKIEIGTNYIKEYISKTMDGFLGIEFEHYAKSNDDIPEANHDHVNDGEDQGYEENVEESDDEIDEEESTDNENAPNVKENFVNDLVTFDNRNDTDSETDDTEFIEIQEDEESSNDGTAKRPDGKRKKKKNKKGQSNGGQPATVVLVQQNPIAHHDDEHEYDHGGTGTEVGHGHEKPNKMKHRKTKRQKRRKNKHQHELVEVDDYSLYGHTGVNGLGLGLLEDLLSGDDWLVDGGKRKKSHPSNYGRSIGVMRGKKKKKKKALMKLVLLGSFLKAKIELLLKILGAHLQIKFFAIALIGLLINIARFWIDVKRGGAPQKVVYVEHAHHQHHYEDHGEEWSEPGSYWKRSMPVDSITDENGVTDSYMPQEGAQFMAYRNQWSQ